MTSDDSSPVKARPASDGPSLVSFYWIGVLTTTIGIVVVFILNMATPFGYVQAMYADLAGRHLWIAVPAFIFVGAWAGGGLE